MGATLELLKLLSEAKVEYVLIGGLAAVLHGSPRATEDVDVCAPLDLDNLKRIVQALAAYHPKFRFHPRKPPLPTDASQLVGFRNLNLGTDLGPIDILGEVTGIGDYQEVARHVVRMDLTGFVVQVLDLDALIIAKRAAGRVKDQLAVPELEAIRERLRKTDPNP